jgi:hypothetical protein
MKGASIMEGEPLELDFDALNRAINEAAECKVGGCSCRVPEPDSLCIGCFLGVMLGDVVWDNERGRLVKEDE